MTDIFDGHSGLIVNPKPGEVETARGVMQALCQVLREHGYVLQHTTNSMVLAKILPGETAMDGSPKAKAIVSIKRLEPNRMQYREFDWDVVTKGKQ